LVFHLNVQTQKFTYLMPCILTSLIQLSLRMQQQEQQTEEQKTISTLISKQERLFLNSVSSIYSRRAYSYFLHNYLKQQGNDSLEQFLSRNPKEIEDELIDFIITSKEKGMKRAAIFNYIKPVISCCKINDVAINTTKVRKFMPPNVKVKKSREYKDYEIQKLLDIADERLRAAILILSSTGIRIGALVGLKLGNLEKAGENGELYKVTVYENEPEEYITFCTSECKEKGIDPYLAMRERFGEVINDSSPLIREQFDKRDQFSAEHPRHVKVIAIAGKLSALAEAAGLRTRLEQTKGKTGNRKGVPNCNGFRR
jgi:integrase